MPGTVMRRLPDSGRHLHPRLDSRVRSRARALRCAGVSARRWRLRHAQLRLRPRFLCARGDRDGKASLGRRLRGRVRRPASRGPGTDRGGFRPCLFFAQMAAAFRRPANHRVPRAGMGAQAFDARRLTSVDTADVCSPFSKPSCLGLPALRLRFSNPQRTCSPVIRFLPHRSCAADRLDAKHVTIHFILISDQTYPC